MAIVFGSAESQELGFRIRHAVTQYHAGLVPRLVLTGGPPSDSEAERMAVIAETLGVPNVDLIVEALSSNTFENARYSREMLRSLGLPGSALAGLTGLSLEAVDVAQEVGT